MKKATKVTNNLRSLRFAHGEMTQAALADKINVTRQTVIAIEQGRYSPTLELAFEIAQVFKVPLEQVFQYTMNDTSSKSKGENEDDSKN